MIRTIKSLALIINYKTFIITGLSLISTWVCIRINLTADLALSMVSVAIVFPIVFAINSAYQRREEALKSLAGIKGHLVSIYLAIKHWGDDKVADHDMLVSSGGLIHKVLDAVGVYLVRDDHETAEFGVYNCISHLSEKLQEMRNVVISAEMSRINEYVSMVLVDFENLKIIKEYRTPITLRTYSQAFIFSFPILFAPFFASTHSMFEFKWITYMIPVIYTFILISLINIQDHMEDPFDGVGEDDIKIEVERFDNLLYELDANHKTAKQLAAELVDI